MGLIKTAILTGGGLYAVNKLAKVAEARQDGRPQAASNSSQYDTRNSRLPPDQPAQIQPQYQTRDTYDPRGEYPPQPTHYLANDNAWAPLPRGYVEREARSSPPQSGRYPSEGPSHEYSPAAPPYSSRQPMGFVDPENHHYEQMRDRSSGSPLPAFAEQAMALATAHGKGKSRKGDGQGSKSDMLASMLSK